MERFLDFIWQLAETRISCWRSPCGFDVQVRQASREAALREIKDRQKKMKADKAKATKAAPKGKAAPKAAPQKMRTNPKA